LKNKGKYFKYVFIFSKSSHKKLDFRFFRCTSNKNPNSNVGIFCFKTMVQMLIMVLP